MYRCETEGEPVIKKKLTANGEVSYIENLKEIPVGSSYSAVLSFETGADERLMGLGQYEDGIYDYRNHTEYLYESNMRIAIPFLITTGGYGILIDSKSSMIFRSEGMGVDFEIDTCDAVSYYVFLAADIPGIIWLYYKVTGLPSMMPSWVFGYIQSRERYNDSGQLKAIAHCFRDRRIPLDCIVQDWYTWETGLWGEKKFDKKRYPDLRATVGKLHEMDIHFMVSVWPNMSPDSDNYRQFAERDLLLPISNVYDAFDERGRELYWEQCREEIMEAGTDALWCDNSEPFSDADWNGEKKRPEKERYRVVVDTSLRSIPAQLTNSYALYHAKGIYENWRRSYPEKRVVNLSRSGYTGCWKWGTILWSGDITARFDTMKKQITEGIKAALCGIPYWTLDIGGFFVVDDKYENRGCNDEAHLPLWFWHGDYNEGVKDPAYRELYVRWLQFGAFLPVFRSHGTDTPREPWNFGEEGDVFYDTIVRYIKLRYALMPYIYSLGAAVHMKGSPMMRSLVMDFGNDENVYDISDEYMFGPAFLVAPVTEPMYYLPGGQKIHGSKKKRRVYLPKGTGWYDFYTNEYFEGGTYVDADAPLSKMPLFVRSGSVIPMSDDGAQSSKEAAFKRLRVYEGQDGIFELYTDEGDGYGFESGVYDLTAFEYKEFDHSITLRKLSGDMSVAHEYETEHITRG